jgi:transglutaminase-like putative cysteine protease
MLLHVLHRTTFVYSGPVRDSFNEVRLQPVTDRGQRCQSFALRLTPSVDIRDYEDLYGNTVHFFDVPAYHTQLVIEAESVVETSPDDAVGSMPAVPTDGQNASSEREMMAEFFSASELVPLDACLLDEARQALEGRLTDVWSDVRRLGQHIYRTFAYRPNTTGVNTTATAALAQRSGVCQDFAHVHLGLCRSLGIPARYVSGYFFNDARRPLEREASHAWIEAFIPGHGWSAYDPTHDRLADQRYIKVATGRDYADIRPVSGTYRGPPAQSLAVDVSVQQVSPVAK